MSAVGRVLAAIGTGFAAFVIAGASGFIQWLAGILQLVPAPTEHWASIIGHMAWPLLIAWIVVRFRHSLRRLFEILIIRFKRDDIDIANVLKVTANSRLVPLQSGNERATSDAAITERLLEYISVSANVRILNQWLNDQGRGALEVREFITLSEYADLRQRAHATLMEGDGHG